MDKMTNVKALTFILNNCKELPADVLAKVKAMKESYEKKADNKKPTEKQKINENLKSIILGTLTEKGQTVTDIMHSNPALNTPDISNQRISALLKQLVDSGEAIKTVDKKKSFFSVVATIEEEDEANEAEVDEQ